MVHVFERQVGGRTLRIESGKVALQAGGSCTIQYGETILLVTATMAPQPREGVDFLPFTVDYEERLYAAGKIPGSFFRREGRPTTEAILAMRQVDRPLRPMFPKHLRNETQVIITALSADQENIPDILGIIGASTALSISEVPFDGPVSGCRIGYVNGELVVNPTYQQLVDSELDLVVAGTKDAVVMVESGANEVSEALLLQALKLGQIVNAEVVELQEDIVRQIGKAKVQIPAKEEASKEVVDAVTSMVNGRLEGILLDADTKADREAGIDRLKVDVSTRLAGKYDGKEIGHAFEDLVRMHVREAIVNKGIRPDGRGTKDIRPITCEVGVLPRTHGTGLFTRGQTQVLSVTTLGPLSMRQRLDTIGVEDTKRYMHHYNFPPYSTGEVRRAGNPGRREIGHGALAERALEPVLPTEEEFPYAIRVVSEVLGSNGSTSMGSVCGSSMSLMDAGVPIKKPVAGTAMGLVKLDNGAFAVLTDIQGMEDNLGDMDFKVAGTADGVTALQMDIKVKGISFQVMEQAMQQAKEARIFILGKMKTAISSPRPNLSKYAPRITRIMINPEKIGAVIGPGGKTIRAIAEETKASIDIEDDGTVLVSSVSEEGSRRAIQIIEGLTKDVEVGTMYTGKVSRIMTFGAFVEIMPGKEGLVHISELAAERVGRVEDVVKVGDEITVMVTELDRMGRINLSRRAVLEGLGGTGARVRDTQTDGADRDGGDDRGPRPDGARGGPPRGGPSDRGPRPPPRRGGYR